MQIIAQTQTPANLFGQLLASASARFQVARADLETYLRGEIRFTKCFNGLINSYDVSAAGHVIQLTPGQSAGCLTCTREKEQQLGHVPGSIAALVMCPAAAAAATRYTINRCWSKYGEAFEAWRRGEQAPEAEALPQPISLAAQHAQLLAGEYPEHAERIARALALVEAGTLEFPEYGTAFDPATFYGNWTCDCPDSVNRKPVAKFGRSCKHAIAGEIARRVKAEEKAIAYRKLTDRLEADRARRLATQGSYDAALKPDRINRKAPHYSQHNGIGHR
jgi:hypothetical protein